MEQNEKKIIKLTIIILVVIGISLIIVCKFLNKFETNVISATDKELGIIKEDTQLKNTDNILDIEGFNKDQEGEEEQSKIKTIKEDKDTINIVLFGIDKRENDTGRSDTIIILSIDFKNNTVKLSSIMRDTYVKIEGYGMTKINHAYAYGGPLLAIKTINQNFELDIRDYVLVNFEGLKEIIDELGGVDISIKSYEIPGMKEYGIIDAGEYHLNGTQALAYCRIRYYGNSDYERTNRQRDVLEKLFNIVKNKNIVQQTMILDKILPYVETSLNKKEVITLMTSAVAEDINKLDEKRFPVDGYCRGEIINSVYYLVIDKEQTTKQINQFIYEN